MTTVAFGEIIWDVYPDESVIGGAPFNFCAHLAHLGDTVYLASATAADALGKQALEHIRRHGVRTELMQISSAPTGRCMVTLNEQKIPQYEVLTDTAYDNMTVTDAYLQTLQDLHADVFYFNTLIQRNPVSRAALCAILEACRFRHIFCDINLRENCFDKESLLRCLSTATILKVSQEEAHFLSDFDLLPAGDDPEFFTKTVAARFPNLTTVVYTLGKHGSAVYDATSNTLYRSGEPQNVPVVSTVGAGDCYGATFLHYYLSGSTIPEAIRLATERSNIVVAHKEAIPF